MGSFSTSFIEKVKEYVAGFIGDNFTEKICYHNIDHTLGVVEACEIIGKNCNLSDTELEIVIIAAWFHDTGYYLGCQNHEEESAKIARRYLLQENRNKDYIETVENCILATEIPQNPKTILEKVICDADLYHLSSEQFFKKTDLLLQEINLQKRVFTTLDWLHTTNEFMENHKYHTPYGQASLLPKLKKNLALLKTRIAQIEH